MGILVDTVQQYEQTEPLERDVMRPRLLRMFGWTIETVLAKDWYESSDREFDRLVRQLEGHAESDEEDQSDEEVEPDEPVESNEPVHPADDGLIDSESLPAGELELASSTVDTEPAPIVAPADKQIPNPNGNAVPIPVGKARRFEFQEGNSSKFWEVTVVGAQHTVRFGRIGSSGQSLTKSFPDSAAAQSDADRLIAEKKRNGYREMGNGN